MGRLRHIIKCSLIYIAVSHVPLILTYVAFRIVFQKVPEPTTVNALHGLNEEESRSQKERINLLRTTSLNYDLKYRDYVMVAERKFEANGEETREIDNKSHKNNTNYTVSFTNSLLAWLYKNVMALFSSQDNFKQNSFVRSVTRDRIMTTFGSSNNAGNGRDSMKSSNSNQWQQPQTNLRHDIPISRKVLWNKTKISKVSSSSAEDYKSWEPNLVQQLSDYIQDRSILKTHPYRVWDINNLRFIPTLKNPCFFVKALGDNETRVPGSNFTLKCLPYFFIYGTEKCGTSDLYHRLEVHQHIQVPIVKETQWFNNMKQIGNVTYHNGTLGGYINMFQKGIDSIIKYCTSAVNPETIIATTKSHLTNQTLQPSKPTISCPDVLVDATPRYLHNTNGNMRDPLNFDGSEPKVLVAHRIHHLLPQAKLIIMLRNPTDRLFSAYKYFTHYYDNQTVTSAQHFHEYVVNGTKNWYLCARLTVEKNCALGFKLPQEFSRSEIYNFKSFKQVRVGLYYYYLKETLSVFPRSNILIINFFEYVKNATAYINEKVLNFIGLKPFNVLAEMRLHRFISKDRIFNKASWEPEEMLPETREILDKFYRPYNIRLAQLLNDSRYASWSQYS